MSRAPFRIAALAAFPALVAACSDATQPDVQAMREPDLTFLTQVAPPGAEPGTCWSKTIRPAVIETVTDQTLVQPAQVTADGAVVSPAVYKTETRQAIVQERQDTWFETPCPDTMTVEFIQSVQRALAARKLYKGAITGVMDARTRTAVRRFQRPNGLDSGILSLASARQLGLANVARPDADAG